MTANGLALAHRFFLECVQPRISGRFPGLRYAAALIGDGSEVLGLDTAMSTDHDWGPRLQLFLSDEDFEQVAPKLSELFDRRLPETFEGWPVRYADKDRAVAADAVKGAYGSSHGIELYTVAGWARRHLDWDVARELSLVDWLAIPEQSLLEATSGQVLRDDHEALAQLRRSLGYFPDDVWLYKLACQWRRIAEEQAFAGRSGEVGDDIGSRVIAARLVRDVMKLIFLVERTYAPYAKWLGSAFQRLPAAARIAVPIRQALAAVDWKDREAALAACYRGAAELQLAREVPGAVAPAIGPYFGRPFIVVNADEIAAGLQDQIKDQRLRNLAPFGSVDQISDSAAVLSDPRRARSLFAGR